MSLANLPAQAVLFVVATASLFVAAREDVRHRLIPNVTGLSVLVAGAGLRLLSEPGIVWISAVVGAVSYVFLAALTHASLIGGGDAKLGTAVTFLVPASEVPALFLDIALAGGLLSIVYLAAKRASLTSDPTLPFGVAILGGSLYRMAVDLCLH